MGIAARYLHGARVCVIPHPENGFKPLALRRRSLAAVAGILLLAKTVALSTAALMPLPAELSTITTARITELTNQRREGAGLNPLAVNPKLSEAARWKARDMLDHDYFAHISPSGTTPWLWISKADYKYQVAGENLAIDFVQAERVVEAWMASPTHRENIMHPDYTETGVAVMTGEFEGGTSTVVVHMFGRPLGAAAPASEPGEAQRTAAESRTAGEQEAGTLPPAEAEAAAPPPAVPEIIIMNEGKTVRNELKLQLNGHPGDLVTVILNGETRGQTTLDAAGISQLTLNIRDVPDGPVTVKARAANSAGRRSPYSETHTLAKDTQGPRLPRDSLVFVASPATDSPSVLLILPGDGYASAAVRTRDTQLELKAQPSAAVPLDNSLAVTLSDEAGNQQIISHFNLSPSFYTERDPHYLEKTARLSRLARWLALSASVVILLLLGAAIVIRINIQHPRMIAHTSLLLVLAAVLLLL